jgi:hypothetical protein
MKSILLANIYRCPLRLTLVNLVRRFHTGGVLCAYENLEVNLLIFKVLFKGSTLGSRLKVYLSSELKVLLLALSGPTCIVCPLDICVKDIDVDMCA